MLTTILPRIAPASTPVSTPLAALPAERHRSAPAATTTTTLLTTTSNGLYGSHVFMYAAAAAAGGGGGTAYGVYPPFVNELQTGARLPQRVEPLHPAPPERLGNHLETVEAHWHNERRKLLMQQREWYRYHGTWSKAFYGSAAEKESYRKQTRITLKQQMEDKDRLQRDMFAYNTQESRSAVAYDRQCVLEDILNHHRKHEYLKHYRDENKKLMEGAWQHQRLSKAAETTHDREQLRYEPINWSHTLK